MPLKSGQLVATQVNDMWQSKKYWDFLEGQWIDVSIGSVCLVISVDLQRVVFMVAGRLCSIHNCYDTADGMPVWCRKL